MVYGFEPTLTNPPKIRLANHLPIGFILGGYPTPPIALDLFKAVQALPLISKRLESCVVKLPVYLYRRILKRYESLYQLRFPLELEPIQLARRIISSTTLHVTFVNYSGRFKLGNALSSSWGNRTLVAWMKTRCPNH